jgi:hypothetical protein
MNFIVIGQLGALIKWLLTCFKNSYRNELYGTGKHTRLLRSISSEFENILLGAFFLALLIPTIVFVTNYFFIVNY